MRVTITGGTGFVGSHTARALLDAGHTVRFLVRDPAKLVRVFEPWGYTGLEHVVGDIADRKTVDEALKGSEAVVHAAAMVSLQSSHAREVLETNARGVELVVGGAIERGVGSIVYVSSIGAMFVPGGDRVTLESPVVSGKGAYARSKAEAEIRVRRLQAEGASIRTTYPVGVIGPDDPGVSEANEALRINTKYPALVTSSGFQFVDVRDLALIHRHLVERTDGAARYIAGGHFVTWSEFADLIDRVTGRQIPRVRPPGALLRGLGRIGDVIKRFYEFDFPLTHEAMTIATRWPGVDDRKTVEEIGIRYRDPAETFADVLAWMGRAGHLAIEKVGRLSAR